MGVKGLWRLLLPIGRRISIETLEGQILAIDASIWLTQFLTVAARQREQDLLGDGSSSYGNASGKAYSYDYLVGFLRRLCKLRYQGVRPVLVFDGETPEIKKREIRERNKRRKRKLGETFYLGDSNKNGELPTQEEEEILAATRRMAKRILAKQLKSGKLVTTKNKERNAKLKALKGQSSSSSKFQPSTNRNSEGPRIASASASYAPGFYDPDASRVGDALKKTGQQQEQFNKKPEKEMDDDHLLRDDYNTNPLKEEINDWDRPVVVDTDDESTHKNKKTDTPTSNPKKAVAKFFGNASRFHAGDGTNFKVESVADLPESDRKDAIEDARKQRRLASRREFMGVASDPDGLSSCQLRNFLKSTKLNQDIAAMAQQAKRKAEEEAKMTLGNGILFEKDSDNATYQRNGINGTRKIYSGVSGKRRQHYLSGQTGRRKVNPGMMRMFHHRDQLQRKKNTEYKKNNADQTYNDEHDFRKKRNNHYLSGGIRFRDRDEEKDEMGYMEDRIDEEKDPGLPHHNCVTIDIDGGFGIAITDGSDKAKTNIEANTMINNGCDDIIEIGSSGESQSDCDDSIDEWKPALVKKNNEATKTSQQLQDAALARALQKIENEEMEVENDAGECIAIDDSDSCNSYASPSREQVRPESRQQEREDGRLARALQISEYDIPEEASIGGGFLVGVGEDNVNVEENIDYGGGFLVGSKEDNPSVEENTDKKGGFVIERKEDKANDVSTVKSGGRFLLPSNNGEISIEGDAETFFSNSKKDTIRAVNALSVKLLSHGNAKHANANKASNAPLCSSPSALNHPEATVSNGFFPISKQIECQKSKNEVLLCNESSEDDADDDIDWEEGNDPEDATIEIKAKQPIESRASSILSILNRKETKEADSKISVHNDCKDDRKSEAINISVAKNEIKSRQIEEIVDSDEEEVDWEEGDNENCSNAQTVTDAAFTAKTTKRATEIALNSTKIIEVRDDTTKDDGDDDNDDDDDEVNWEDGDNGIDQSEATAMNVCSGNKSHGTENSSVDKQLDWEVDDNEVQRSEKENVDLSGKREERNMPESPPKSTSDNFEGSTKENEENVESPSIVQQNPNIHVEATIGIKNSAQETSKYFGTSAKTLSKSNTIDLEDGSGEDTDTEWESGEKRTIVELDDWGVTKSHKSDDVAAALEHAQGTAANLTNWAGRAFRRAIAQHAIENGMEVPESAKPSALKNERKDVEREESSSNEADNKVPFLENNASKGTIKSRNKETRTYDDTIDNSRWLESMDTSNICAEDYTVAPQEANSSDRLLDIASGGVTEEMRTEVMQLLRLFGIPYVVAPAEAEAQCVELERLGLVDGIVTEDSDTFVFGGQVVYKNIFDDKKYVEVYHAKDASEEMNLTQDSMVALAMLLGGDYTEGVKGVGIVNGMEVLQAFDVAQDCEAGLKRFRKWLDGFDPNDLAKKSNDHEPLELRSEKEQVFHRKHHTARTRWIAPKHFPDSKVLNAYLNPVVDNSTERFSWGVPDLDGLIAFCHSHMGWIAEETEKLIVPIIQQMEGGSMRQTRIDSFMRYEDGIKFAKIQSKRLRQVLGLSSKGIEQPPQRKVVPTTAHTTSQSFDQEQINNEFSEGEESFGEPDEEIFAAMDASIMAMHEKPNENTKAQRKKRYNGKRTRSLAALSSASASTIAIARSSKDEGMVPASTKGTLISVTRQSNSIPKKAPPSYQKQSSTILEEEKESASQSILSGTASSSTYEVINPSMI